MDLVEQYQTYRQGARNLNNRIMAGLEADWFVGAAEWLGLVHEGTVFPGSREELEILLDFAIHDYRVDGKNAVQRFREKVAQVSDAERALLDALEAASTSLFRIITTSPEERWLLLADVLSGPPRLKLTDMNFSQTAQRGTLIFTRIVSIHEIHMTSGLAFLFRGDKEQHLLDECERMRQEIASESEALKRFVAFFRLNKKEGLKVRYQ